MVYVQEILLFFRAKDNLLPELLPFIVQNDKFFDYAVKHSAGGLSPRVKFKDLANYEFLLPPKEQQAELAELLWAIDQIVENELNLLNKLNINIASYIKQILTYHILSANKEILKVKSLFQTRWENREFPRGWKNYKLKDIIENSQTGFADGRRDINGIPQLRMNNVNRHGRIDLTSVINVPKRKNIENYLIQKNDVLFCNTNSEDLVGKSIISDEQIEGFTFSNHFTRLRPNIEILLPKFLFIWLKYHFEIGLFERRCTRWIGQASVQKENLLNLYIIIPPIEEQIYAIKIFESLENGVIEVQSKIYYSKALQKSLINQVF